MDSTISKPDGTLRSFPQARALLRAQGYKTAYAERVLRSTLNGMAYTGLEGVIAALQGKLNQGQVNNLQAGYTGGNGYGVGGMHGAFAGLSPQAVHWLAQSGLLEKNAPQQMATTDASGAPLTGDALFQAQFMVSFLHRGAGRESDRKSVV